MLNIKPDNDRGDNPSIISLYVSVVSQTLKALNKTYY